MWILDTEFQITKECDTCFLSPTSANSLRSVGQETVLSCREGRGREAVFSVRYCGPFTSSEVRLINLDSSSPPRRAPEIRVVAASAKSSEPVTCSAEDVELSLNNTAVGAFLHVALQCRLKEWRKEEREG
ncbi:hypothetical protein E2C01_035626 [Portunus trituberculatus]|uniref:Uncharacterized protein n=1 Tax=Portunus trituberculatus TaxID=210409 RepID=A0A5B7FBY9_PORTR|nr:hypothetical protein [Portunus trituberculatus]